MLFVITKVLSNTNYCLLTEDYLYLNKQLTGVSNDGKKCLQYFKPIMLEYFWFCFHRIPQNLT